MLPRVSVDRPQLDGHVLLVVEDEPIIALDIVDCFRRTGASVLTAHNLSDGLRLAGHPDLSAAVLDIKIGGEDCSPICRLLSERGIPFLFHTAYSKAAVEDWNGAPVIGKPVNREQILDAVEALCRPRQTAAD